MMVGEGELDVVLVDSEDVAEFGALQFLQKRDHGGQNFLEKVE